MGQPSGGGLGKPLGRGEGEPPVHTLAPGTPIAPSHFELRDDGTISPDRGSSPTRSASNATDAPEDLPPATTAESASPPNLLYRSETPFIRLYHGNCLELLDAIYAKYPEGRFDCIFADPPYFLSNGGIIQPRLKSVGEETTAVRSETTSASSYVKRY